MQYKTFYDNSGMIVTSIYGDLSYIDISQWDHLNCIDQYAESNVHWVDAGVVKNRLENPATLLGFTISNIPCNGKLYIDNNEYDITDSTVDLEIPSGTYKIKLECFPYLPKSFEVTA